ncbi:MAG: ammonium transporter [Pseudomonadota bacterium]
MKQSRFGHTLFFYLLALIFHSSIAFADSAAAPTKPFITEISKINSGDTAWMLVSTAFVLMMTIPGLALFYSGLVRKKNALSTIGHSFSSVLLVSVLWGILGYSLAFMPGSPWLGGMDRFFLKGLIFLKDEGKLTVHHAATTIPESLYMMYQLTFAVITPALISGAFAERMKFSSMMVFVGLWSLLVYSPIAHWVWEPSGWLAAKGVLDFAGGTAVHINAGIAGLVVALVLGRRSDFRTGNIAPHNLVLTLTGTFLLWVGWFGFNAGSALAADGRAGMAMMTTHMATAAAALSWGLIEYVHHKRASLLGLASGAVSGLVAITPAAGFVNFEGSLLIGIAAGIACYFCSTSLKEKFGYDDSLDVFGIHGVGGIVGSLLTGVLAVKEIGGVEGSFSIQLLGVIATIIYSGLVTAVILFVIKNTFGLRVSREAEEEGLDLSEHGESIESSHL